MCFLPCVLLQVSAWGGYVFIINLIPLHVFVLLLMQRYSRRVYIGKTDQRRLGQGLPPVPGSRSVLAHDHSDLRLSLQPRKTSSARPSSSLPACSVPLSQPQTDLSTPTQRHSTIDAVRRYLIGIYSTFTSQPPHWRLMPSDWTGLLRHRTSTTRNLYCTLPSLTRSPAHHFSSGQENL